MSWQPLKSRPGGTWTSMLKNRIDNLIKSRGLSNSYRGRFFTCTPIMAFFFTYRTCYCFTWTLKAMIFHIFYPVALLRQLFKCIQIMIVMICAFCKILSMLKNLRKNISRYTVHAASHIMVVKGWHSVTDVGSGIMRTVKRYHRQFLLIQIWFGNAKSVHNTTLC